MVFRDLQHRVFYWTLGALGLATVIYLTLTPNPPSSGLGFANADKLLHLLSYFVLAAWFGQLLRGEGPLSVMALILVIIGFALEWLQGLGSVRQRELADAVANGSGVMLAWYLCRGPFGELLTRFEQRWLARRSEDSDIDT